MPHGVTRVPISPIEIAEEAVKCREAGAAIVHFHARDREGITTGDPAVFQETIRLIRERSDILIQTTNGIGARRDKVTGEIARPSDADRLGLLSLNPPPDLYGAAIGTTDYIHVYGGQPNERPFVNNADWLKTSIRHAHSTGSSIEFECVHVPALYRLKRFADEGLFDANADYLWLTHAGGIANAPAIARVVLNSLEEGRILFPRAKFGVFGCGPHQFPMSALGLSAGCDTLRIGLEDNLLMPNGEAAESSHQLIAEAVRLATFFNRRPATPDEARQILGLNRTKRLGAAA
jgi:3-keto-5-aminohexanoate cleavage enzyme